MHILHTFPKKLIRRICLTIKSCFNRWSSSLFSSLSCLFQGWYCKEKLDASHSKEPKGLRSWERKGGHPHHHPVLNVNLPWNASSRGFFFVGQRLYISTKVLAYVSMFTSSRSRICCDIFCAKLVTYDWCGSRGWARTIKTCQKRLTKVNVLKRMCVKNAQRQ